MSCVSSGVGACILERAKDAAAKNTIDHKAMQMIVARFGLIISLNRFLLSSVTMDKQPQFQKKIRRIYGIRSMAGNENPIRILTTKLKVTLKINDMIRYRMKSLVPLAVIKKKQQPGNRNKKIGEIKPLKTSVQGLNRRKTIIKLSARQEQRRYL
jgi:hypothetical protein